MTMRRWLVVMWAMELSVMGGTAVGVIYGLRHGWYAFAVAVGVIGAAVVPELLLKVWRRWCPDPLTRGGVTYKLQWILRAEWQAVRAGWRSGGRR